MIDEYKKNKIDDLSTQSRMGKEAYVLFIYLVLYVSTINFWFIHSGKNNLVRLVFFVLLITTTFLSLMQFVISRKMPKHIFFLLCYFVLCIFSAIIGNNVSFGSLYPYIILPCFIFSVYSCKKKITPEIIIKLIVIIGAVVAVLCCYEYFSHSYVLDTPTNMYRIFRPQVYAESPLTMGCQMAITSILSLGLYKNDKKKIWFLIFIISFMALLFTQSRGPLVGWIMGIYTFWVNDSRRKPQSIKTGFFILSFLIVFLIGIAILLMGSIQVKSSNVIVLRVLSIFNWSSDEGNLGRLYKWRIYLTEFISNPILGKGIGYIDNSPYGVTESGWLQQLVEIGMVGTIVYYYIVISNIIKGIRLFKLFYSDSYVFLGMASACICTVVYNVVYQVFDSTIVGTLFWILIGLMATTAEDRKI